MAGLESTIAQLKKFRRQNIRGADRRRGLGRAAPAQARQTEVCITAHSSFPIRVDSLSYCGSMGYLELRKSRDNHNQ